MRSRVILNMSEIISSGETFHHGMLYAVMPYHMRRDAVSYTSKANISLVTKEPLVTQQKGAIQNM